MLFTASMAELAEDGTERRFGVLGPGRPAGGAPDRSVRASSGRRAARSEDGHRAGREEEAVLRQDDERSEELRGGPLQQVVTVTGIGARGHESVHAEMHLLAALEVAGVRAAPDVLSREDDGYQREGAPPLDLTGGRRAAAVGNPATGERLALGRAREDLDAFIDALHERGWVLGAPQGTGIGRRGDGTVIVRDLRGLHRAEELAARRADRRWIDSVLGDQERTLRRRVHQLDQRPGHAWISGPLDAPPEPAAPEDAVEDAAESESDPTQRRTVAPLPVPRTGSRARASAGAPRRPASMLRTTRQALSQPGALGTVVLTAMAVLLGGAVVAGAAWLLLAPPGPFAGPTAPSPAAPSPTAPSPAAPTAAAPAPEITDPWDLAAQLAGTRHAYVTGTSPVSAAAPGSPAQQADDEIRAAYDGATVRGGGPVVHDAALEGVDPNAGTAVLTVVTSVEAHEVIESDGAVTAVPATAPSAVELEVRWDGSDWLVVQSRPAVG